jgi:hypothetical protein
VRELRQDAKMIVKMTVNFIEGEEKALQEKAVVIPD